MTMLVIGATGGAERCVVEPTLHRLDLWRDARATGTCQTTSLAYSPCVPSIKLLHWTRRAIRTEEDRARVICYYKPYCFYNKLL